ncbi:hypothetical protein FKM82_006549 [Ascaphus truei]
MIGSRTCFFFFFFEEERKGGTLLWVTSEPGRNTKAPVRVRSRCSASGSLEGLLERYPEAVQHVTCPANRTSAAAESHTQDMAEAQPAGSSKYNPEAADFIPRERPSHHSGWRSHGRAEGNRSWSRNSNLPTTQHQQLPKESLHESAAQKMHTYNSSANSNNERIQQGSPETTSASKPVKNHSFQNQRWQRSRSERSHTRSQPRQPLSDTSAKPVFVGAPPFNDWRVKTREPADFYSSESEEVVGSAESRGAKPKRLTHVSGGSLRGPRDRTKHSYDREKRVAPKQKAEEMFENIPPRDGKSGASKEQLLKTGHDQYEGDAGSEEKQKHECPEKTPRESLKWNKPQEEDQVRKQNEPQGSKNLRPDKSQPAVFTSKDKKTDRGKDPLLSNAHQEPTPKPRVLHRLPDGDKHLGRKHPPQDHAPKTSVQSGWSRQWNKHDMPKNKETHTGCLIEQLTTEKYECMVCCEVVRVMAPVWSCQSCYHVFHLNCIKKWARSPASQAEDFIHTCENLCHEGECGTCSRTSNIACRCGFKTKEVPCALIQTQGDFTFICDKRCNKKRLCGRHKCNEICCVEKEHKCSLICGHKLNCGLHRCDQVCHRGNCQNCWQTSFDELACYCGESVIFPPVPCGTRPPECKNSCTREHECDHPVFHSCHSEEKCPPCTYLTQKWCMGKHELRNNIPCHLSDISCGLRCNQLLKCGMHKCKRICHKGECLIDEDCKQPCTFLRSDCGHPCMAPCHPSQPCPTSVCSAKVDLLCECGRRKERVFCTVASSTYQRIAAISIATKLTDMQLGDTVEIGRLVTKKEMKQTRLQCDEDCMTLERNRRLAEALNISDTSDPFNARSSGSKYSDSLKEDARKDLKFVSEIEREIKALVDAVNKGKQTKKSHCFPPMNRDHRKIIHDLAEVYCVESVSYDNEPKRNVVITAVKGKSMCPNVALMTVIERENQTRPPPPIAHYRHQTERNGGSSSAQKATREEPVIDYFDVQD